MASGPGPPTGLCEGLDRGTQRILLPLNNPKIELNHYDSRFSPGNKLSRGLWSLVWLFFFRPSPVFLHPWRNALLRLFGAKIGMGAHIYPGVRIWAPWNLVMGEGAGLGPGVDCYCVDKVEIGPWAVVSQRAFLCTASHDVRSKSFKLVTAPIKIGAYAWIAAEAFIGPGVKVGEGAVAGARACVSKDVHPWTIVVGNPARRIGKRIIRGFK